MQTPPPVPPRTDVHKQASVQTPPPVPPRTDVHKQASVQTPPPVPPRTDVHKQASVQTPPPVPPRTDVHKQASVQTPPPVPPRTDVHKQASVQTPPQVPPRTDVHKQASVQIRPQVPPRTDVHKQVSVQTPPPVPPRTDVHKQASVQTRPQVPPRTDVHKQASVQTRPQVPLRTDVHGQAAVQNTPRPAPPGAEDLRRSELKREVLLQPETKVMSNPKSHVAKNATIQAENVAKVKNDVVKKNSVPEKKSLKDKILQLKNKILQFFSIHHSKDALLNLEQRKALAYENRDLINKGVRNILALDVPQSNESTRLEAFGVFRRAHREANNTQTYFQQTINKMAEGNGDLFNGGDDVVAFFNIFKYAINQAYTEMKSGQDKETAKDAFNEMVSLLGSMQQHFANADKNTYNFNNVAKVMFSDMPEALSHLNLEKPTFNLPDGQ
ncbi:hypothetical protein [Citrobacter sp. FDAARGOS_156]|uniref:hypothetical protein n=1 Tax=Citrobacter sp. FDAARGOS_156 TaxID=1702170 RepID=UPI0018FFED0B|nr:hypothetical protein [Citrobacter sp. FDAARGOS_156]MBJ9556676.1 hypothetical protein [Citrobacter sp. FDAARGOS_156]